MSYLDTDLTPSFTLYACYSQPLLLEVQMFLSRLRGGWLLLLLLLLLFMLPLVGLLLEEGLKERGTNTGAESDDFGRGDCWGRSSDSCDRLLGERAGVERSELQAEEALCELQAAAALDDDADAESELFCHTESKFQPNNCEKKIKK